MTNLCFLLQIVIFYAFFAKYDAVNKSKWMQDIKRSRSASIEESSRDGRFRPLLTEQSPQTIERPIGQGEEASLSADLNSRLTNCSL